MTASPQEILARAANIIQDRGWTRGSFARDGRGGTIHPFAPEACRFCALGAMRFAAYEALGYGRATATASNKHGMEDLAKQAASLLGGHLQRERTDDSPHWDDIAHWNDYEAPDGAYVVARMREAAAA